MNKIIIHKSKLLTTNKTLVIYNFSLLNHFRPIKLMIINLLKQKYIADASNIFFMLLLYILLLLFCRLIYFNKHYHILTQHISLLYYWSYSKLYILHLKI